MRVPISPDFGHNQVRAGRGIRGFARLGELGVADRLLTLAETLWSAERLSVCCPRSCARQNHRSPIAGSPRRETGTAGDRTDRGDPGFHREYQPCRAEPPNPAGRQLPTSSLWLQIVPTQSRKWPRSSSSSKQLRISRLAPRLYSFALRGVKRVGRWSCPPAAAEPRREFPSFARDLKCSPASGRIPGDGNVCNDSGSVSEAKKQKPDEGARWIS